MFESEFRASENHTVKLQPPDSNLFRRKMAIGKKANPNPE